MNIILFGGSFNPIHNGHLNMAKYASESLDADVIFIPNKTSVWKSEDTLPNDKFNMVSLAIKDYQRFSVSDFELKSDVDNYSYLTIRHFKTLYPNDKLFFLIGTDQVNSFHKWKNAEEIADNVDIIFYDRPGFIPSNDNIKRFKMLKINGEVEIDVSSTEIKSLRNLKTPFSIIKYISDNNLYYMTKIRSYLDLKRFNHVKSVALVALEIALSNNLKDPWKYYIAGLLHDIGKTVSKDDIKWVEEKYKDVLPIHWKLYHQFTSRKIAHDDFNIEDEDILSAIEYHATGKQDMTPIQMIVYSADKIDPLRGYDSSDMIKACKENYRDGFIYVLKENKIYLESKKSDISNALTSACFKQYLGS